MPAEFPAAGFALEATLTAIRGFVDDLEALLGGTLSVESVPGTPIDIADAATVVADVYVGITVAEQTTITEALVRVRDEDATGSILDSIPLLPGEGVSYVYAPGRTATSGTVYVEVVSGTVEGSVFTV